MSEPFWVPLGGAQPPVVPNPIQLQTPRTATLNGNSFWTVAALTNYDFGHWEFLRDVDGYVYGQVRVAEPRAAPMVLLALAANATAGITRMNVSYSIVKDGQSLNPGPFTAIAAQDITVPATALLRKDATFALGVPLAAGDLVEIAVGHIGSHANDTLAANTWLAGAWLI